MVPDWIVIGLPIAFVVSLIVGLVGFMVRYSKPITVGELEADRKFLLGCIFFVLLLLVISWSF